MAKVKEIHISLSYTYSPAAYHSVKGEAAITAEVNDGEDFRLVADDVREEAQRMLVMNLAGIAEVHEDIYKKGLDPEDLVDSDSDDDDEEFEDFFSVDED